MKKIKIKYLKLSSLFLIYITTTIFFYKAGTFLSFHKFLVSLGYAGILLGGVFYAYAFTAAPATAVLLVLAKEQDIISAGIIGGLGAFLSDVLIFQFIRHSFIDEIENLKKEKFVLLIKKAGKKIFGSFDDYLLPVFASLLIASPLPTEIGVALMAALKNMSVKKFLIIAYLLHTLGIFIILVIGNVI